MDEVMKRECSIVSRTKIFQPEETILGDGAGLTNFVHFITKGTCCVIEHLVVRVSVINGIKHYHMYKSHHAEDEDTESRLERSVSMNKSVSTSRPSGSSLKGSKILEPGPSTFMITKSKRTLLKRKPTLKDTRKNNASTIPTTTSRISRVGITESKPSDEAKLTGKFFSNNTLLRNCCNFQAYQIFQNCPQFFSREMP